MRYLEQIKAGAALLDSKARGWRQELDLDLLDMGNSARCILGQVFGDYDVGYETLGLCRMDERKAHGFSLGADWTEAGGEYVQLTQEWREYLTGGAL